MHMVQDPELNVKKRGRKVGYTPSPEAIQKQKDSIKANNLLEKPTTIRGWKRPDLVIRNSNRKRR